MDNMDLFSAAAARDKVFEPLAQRMRPRDFGEFIGQGSVTGSGAYLRKMIEKDQVPSLILYGPPGTGKTTLAQIIAEMTDSEFVKLNAVAAGIADIRKIVKEAAEQRSFYQRKTIVFIDEIHRFNKSQQDVLLPYVEDGRLILIGATTENPFFEVNHALLSRVRIVRLQALTVADVEKILANALQDEERGLGRQQVKCAQDVLLTIAEISGGDARVALNLLEQAAAVLTPGEILDDAVIGQIVGERMIRYDKQGDNHYDVVSAFIKSMRGSDPDAAIHYLARMIAAGEDCKFIARRIAICAAEDVGLADPQALTVAMAAVNAVQFVGMPEARIPLAEAAIYVASAPKSNSAIMAIDTALADVKTKNIGEIPLHLRDAHYKGAAKLGHGTEYIYPHNFPGHFKKQQYLPDELLTKKYYQPSDNGAEQNIRTYLQRCWGRK